MERLSVIAFSRDDVDKVESFVKDLHELADEIVLVDSSDKKNRDRLHAFAKNYKKLKIFYVVAIGYPDPLFMYAINKCTNRWVLYLDTDERLSEELERKIKKMIENRYAAYNIKRYEGRRSSNKNIFFTWQIHLFQKGKVKFKGIIHEQPTVYGPMKDIYDDNLYMEHIEELMRHELMEYHRMEKYERYSNRLFDLIVRDYLRKLFTKKGLTAKIVIGSLRAYQKITFRNSEHEIGYAEYFTVRFLRYLLHQIGERDVVGVFKALPFTLMYISRLTGWRTERDGRENFEIAKLMNTIGITEFLHLDDERSVRRLNAKYENGQEQGLRLLMRLLTLRYRDVMGSEKERNNLEKEMQKSFKEMELALK